MSVLSAFFRSGHAPVRGRRSFLLAAVSSILLNAVVSEAQVVPDYEHDQPLNQQSSPGLAARWAAQRGIASPHWSQPVRVILDGEGTVTVYHSRPVVAVAQPTPAQFGVTVGHSYRLKISNIPELPGVELFPTIEIIDRLHPPAGMADEFPVPIHISNSDIELALSGNLVTRVVYLEQPQFAAPYELDESTRVRQLLPTENPIAQADRFGRPMVIVRLGGRMPSVLGEPVTFWGSGGGVFESRIPVKAPVKPAAEPAPQDTSAVDVGTLGIVRGKFTTEPVRRTDRTAQASFRTSPPVDRSRSARSSGSAVTGLRGEVRP